MSDEAPDWTEEARVLFNQMQALLAGADARDGLNALCQSLVIGIGLASATPAEAEETLRKLLPVMIGTLKESWGNIIEIQARSLHQAGRA